MPGLLYEKGIYLTSCTRKGSWLPSERMLTYSSFNTHFYHVCSRLLCWEVQEVSNVPLKQSQCRARCKVEFGEKLSVCVCGQIFFPPPVNVFQLLFSSAFPFLLTISDTRAHTHRLCPVCWQCRCIWRKGDACNQLVKQRNNHHWE